MDNHTTFPNLIQHNKGECKKTQRNRIAISSNYNITLNNTNSFFKSNSNSKDKLQSIAHSQKMMNKFNDLCKAYNTSLHLNPTTKKKSINQINDERLIYNRLPIRKHLVTNISMQKPNQTNDELSKTHDPNLKSFQLSKIPIQTNDFWNKKHNTVRDNKSIRYSEINLSSFLKKSNESKDKRCSSASSSYYVKKKPNTIIPMSLLISPKNKKAIQKKGHYVQSSLWKSNKVYLKNRNKLRIDLESNQVNNAIEINNDINTNISLQIKDQKEGVVIDQSEKQCALTNNNNVHQQNAQNNTIVLKENKGNGNNIITSIIKSQETDEASNCNNNITNIILLTNNSIEVSKEEQGNNNNNNIISSNNNANHQPINSKEVNNHISNKKKFKKSKTIQTQGPIRRKGHKNTILNRSKNYLQLILQEAEHNQIEKRQKEMINEFPVIAKTELNPIESIPEINEEKETLLNNNNVHLDTEDDGFCSNEQHQKINLKTSNQSDNKEVFSFKMLKNDTQDTVPTSRLSDAEKHEFVNENNLSDYNSSVHSLSISTIIAKNKKPSVCLKNYMTQLSKISEFSYPGALKNQTESLSSSSEHRSVKSNEIGELEPLSPINSIKILKKSTTVNFNSNSFKRCQKKFKTEIKEAILSNDYFSSQSDDNCYIIARDRSKSRSYCSMKQEKSFQSDHINQKKRIMSSLGKTKDFVCQSSLISKLNKDVNCTIKEINTKTDAVKQSFIETKFVAIEKKYDELLFKEVVYTDNNEDIKVNNNIKGEYQAMLKSLNSSNEDDDSYFNVRFPSQEISISLNKSYCIDYLHHNYFEVSLVKKLILEQYFSKDFEMISLPTLFFNFAQTNDHKISFKRRKMNVIQRNVPFLIKLTPDCMTFYNLFLSYDNPDNKNLIHNASRMESNIFTQKKSSKSKVSANSIFRIRNQNRRDTLTKSNPFVPKTYRKIMTKKYRNSLSNGQLAQPKQPKDSILNSNFYNRTNVNVSHESFEEDDIKLSKKRRTIILVDPSLLLNKVKRNSKFLKKYEDVSIFNKNNVLSKTNKIKSKILTSLKSHIETLFFYIKDRNYPQFKETYEKYLIDPGIKDYEGNSLLSLAVQCNSFQIVNFLLNMGADPNDLNKNNNSPLHYALTFHYFEIADMLIKRGANETIQNKRGLTPWQCLDSAISIV